MSGQKRITKELGELLNSPPTGITVFLPSEADIHKWSVVMQGPPGSVFAAGKFHLKLILPPQYPFSSPIVIFTTPIHHPNVSPAGFIFPPANTATTHSNQVARARVTAPPPASTPAKASAATSATEQTPQSNICLPMLRANAWKPSTRISEILLTAQQLLAEPSAEDVLEGDVGRQWRDERKAWEAKAKSWVEQYAKA